MGTQCSEKPSAYSLGFAFVKSLVRLQNSLGSCESILGNLPRTRAAFTQFIPNISLHSFKIATNSPDFRVDAQGSIFQDEFREQFKVDFRETGLFSRTRTRPIAMEWNWGAQRDAGRGTEIAAGWKDF